jgi:hypothetical protein
MRQSLASVVLLLMFALPGMAFAQNGAGVTVEGPTLIERGREPLDANDARRVRGELQRLLTEHPPNLRTVLQADPSLLTKGDYLAPYPRVAEFLKAHPEVARDPAFFLGQPDGWNRQFEETPTERASRRAYDTLQGFLAGLAVFTGVMAVLWVLFMLVRQALNHRRWSKQSRVQTEVHTKILDRLQSNEELLAYIQTPAGQRFLQSGPSPLSDPEPKTIGAPFGRIISSVQVGVVLVALGLGFWLVQRAVPSEVAPAFNAMGIIAAALGLGAIGSGAVSYVLSARLGLLERKSE